jgi:hypothetical protein
VAVPCIIGDMMHVGRLDMKDSRESTKSSPRLRTGEKPVLKTGPPAAPHFVGNETMKSVVRYLIIDGVVKTKMFVNHSQVNYVVLGNPTLPLQRSPHRVFTDLHYYPS